MHSEFSQVGYLQHIRKGSSYLISRGPYRRSIVWDWDNAIWGASVLLAAVTPGVPSIYSTEVERAMTNWMNGLNGTVITPKGLAWSNDWGSLRNAANAGMCCFALACRDIIVS